MKRKRNEDLNRIAEALSDDTPIDWERIAADHHELEHEIAGLRLIERIAEVHRNSPPARLRAADLRGAQPPALFVWGPLRVLEKIGEGSYGSVWRAYDPELQRDVALKLFHEDLPAGSLDTRRLLDEARRMARVRHPNVVFIHGATQHGGKTGFWADLVVGESLEERLESAGTLGAGEAALIGIELCRALAAVHEAGLVHGDVKARNVMRDSRGRILLTDFGAARELEDGGAGARRVFGSPLNMAPEVLRGAPVVASTDLYALGVLLYRLVSGAYPVPAQDLDELEEKHRRGDRVPLRDVRPDLPAGFVDLIDRSVARDPEERFRSAGEMEAALRSFVSAAEGGPSPPARRRKGLRWVPVGIAVVAVAAALLAIGQQRSRTTAGSPTVAMPQRFETPAAPAPLATEGRPAESEIATLPALAGEATLYRSRGGSKEALAPGSLVRGGDALFLEMRISRAAHVYILNEDATGNLAVVFPLAGLDLQNPLDADNWHRLPGARDGVSQDWEMSGGPGPEGFLVIASLDPIDDLDARVRSLMAEAASSPEPPPATDEHAGATTRGIHGIVPVDPAAQGEPNSRLAALMRSLLDQAGGPGGLWLRHFVLFNTGD
jgi:hypothetical protein